MARMATTQLWTAEAIATSSAVTSAAVDIGNSSALALHVTALTGTTPDVTFTYTLSNSRNGTFLAPASPVTIGASIGAADILDFAPEAAQFIKIVATNNSGANIATLTAQLASQEIS
jgi:hypothetical protein